MLLSAAALAFIWLLRWHAPAVIRCWFQPVPFSSPLDLGLLLVALCGAVVLHEGGHLATAVALRFKLLGGSIGPLRIQALHGKYKLSFDLKRCFTGSVSAVPDSLAQWRLQMAAVAVAGPLATLGTAIAAMNLHPAGHHLVILQMAFVQVSLLIFSLGLIPNGSNGRSRNDMRLLLDLYRQQGCVEEIELYLMLSQNVLQGVRPQDYPPALVARLSGWRGRPESRWVFAQALFRRALDNDEIQAADAWDSHTLALANQCNRQTQNAALASSGCFDLLFREDLESAQSKLARVNCSMLFPPCFEHLTRAAQHVAQGRLHRAPAEIIRAQYALPRGIASYALERSLLERLHMKVLGASLEHSHTRSTGACAGA